MAYAHHTVRTVRIQPISWPAMRINAIRAPFMQLRPIPRTASRRQDRGSSGKANENWYGSGEGQSEGQRGSSGAENEKSASRARIRSDFAKLACY